MDWWCLSCAAVQNGSLLLLLPTIVTKVIWKNVGVITWFSDVAKQRWIQWYICKPKWKFHPTTSRRWYPMMFGWLHGRVVVIPGRWVMNRSNTGVIRTRLCNKPIGQLGAIKNSQNSHATDRYAKNQIATRSPSFSQEEGSPSPTIASSSVARSFLLASSFENHICDFSLSYFLRK